jgi:hypothetical protein
MTEANDGCGTGWLVFGIAALVLIAAFTVLLVLATA